MNHCPKCGGQNVKNGSFDENVLFVPDGLDSTGDAIHM